MALPIALDKRPLPAGSLATMPTQDDIARHPFLRRYVRVSWLDWFTGWELLNEAGYGAELWLGPDVTAALAEWRALWGGAPCIALPRPTRQHISSSDVYTPEWADALAASIANTTPGETPRQTCPDVLPQSLQSQEDVLAQKRDSEVTDTASGLEAAALANADVNPNTRNLLGIFINRFMGKANDNPIMLIEECYLKLDGDEVKLCHRRVPAIVVGKSLLPGEPMRPVWRQNEIEEFLSKVKAGDPFKSTPPFGSMPEGALLTPSPLPISATK